MGFSLFAITIALIFPDKFMYDVAVLGASVSGASLALRLGRCGHRVALIDRDHFPRRKPCGEGVSDIAIASLREVGISDLDISNLGGKPFYFYRLDWGTESVRLGNGRIPRLKGIGIPRARLDNLLVNRAAELPSVDLFTGELVSEIHDDPGSVSIRLGTGRSLHARFLAIADGTRSSCSTKMGIPKTRKGTPLWGISFVLQGSYAKETGEVLVLLKDGFEVYCTPVANDQLNVALLTPKDSIGYLQCERVRDELFREVSEKTGFEIESRGVPMQTGPVNENRRPLHFGSALLVGDAAESLDPIAGMGITQGIKMSEFAANAFDTILRDGLSQAEAFEAYAASCQEMGRYLRGFTKLTASALRSRFRRKLLPALSCTGFPNHVRNTLSAHFSAFEEEAASAFFSSILRASGRCPL